MNSLRQLLNIWVVLGAILFGLILIAMAFLILDSTRPEIDPPGVPTAQVSIIQAPTATPLVTVPPSSTATPTLAVPPSPLPGVLAPGALVQIVGTGGEGLNLRAEPGLNTGIQYLGFESEVFTIVEGPVEADGFTWWRLVAFADETRSGWGAANFLEVVQTPQ